MTRLVTQEHTMGCSVACTAFVLGISYKCALKLFLRPHYAKDRGFYCKDIISALNKAGRDMEHCYLTKNKSNLVKIPGTIVYIKQSNNYPFGHYLVKAKSGKWMNPWINYPNIAPAKSGYQNKLPGKAIYAIFPKSK